MLGRDPGNLLDDRSVGFDRRAVDAFLRSGLGHAFEQSVEALVLGVGELCDDVRVAVRAVPDRGQRRVRDGDDDERGAAQLGEVECLSLRFLRRG